MGTFSFRTPADLIDPDRYPVAALDSEAARHVVRAQQRALDERGVAILPGFVRPEAVAAMARQAESLRERAFLENVWGTPYLELPDESFPEGHPRRSKLHSLTWVLAYDLIPKDAPLRALYEWDPLKDFIAAIFELDPLYRMADPLGALNCTLMDEGHVQCWHYDNADFVVSLAIQQSEAGGLFECAPHIRSGSDENYDEVAAVIAGEASSRVEVLPMTPGTLMIFAGRNSLHRVSPVEGTTARCVGLFAYDTRPDADSSELLKLVRYGRTAPVAG